MTRDAEIDIQSYDYAKYLLFTGFPDNESALTAMRIAFSDGAKWADAHPHWISVGDELPKENDYVLICNNRGLMTTSLYENEEWVISETYLAVNVTHWMPLPSVEHLKKGGEK